MIWYFIAGFISGAVGMLMLGRYLSERKSEREEDD